MTVLTTLRGSALREHLASLSKRYSWSLLGNLTEVGPLSVTKRRPVPRQAVQTPVRNIRTEVDDLAQSLNAKRVNFLANMNNDSSEEDDSKDEDEFEALGDSMRGLGIVEYVAPIVRRPILTNVLGENAKAPQTELDNVAATGKPKVAKSSSKQNNNKFKRERLALTSSMFSEFNSRAFRGELPHDMVIKWNKRLLTTAGITKLKLQNDKRVAVVELSEKVLDDEERLKNTLLHELCHAAAWIVDAERRPPHGRSFWKWAKIATNAFPDASITTCHSYLIHKPFTFQCTNSACAVEYKRHSKSINCDTHRCGACTSRIAFMGKSGADGTPRAQKVNGFAAYVKEHFARAKKTLNSPKAKRSRSGAVATHQSVMSLIATWYQDSKSDNPFHTPAPIESKAAAVESVTEVF